MKAHTTHKKLHVFHVQLWEEYRRNNQLFCQAYRKNATCISTIKKWIKKFKKGDCDLNDKLQET